MIKQRMGDGHFRIQSRFKYNEHYSCLITQRLQSANKAYNVILRSWLGRSCRGLPCRP
jgi:hypothetical protein